jgi:uncharacterized protein YndB with AHSA1/START domain
MKPSAANHVFRALADPRRRALFEELTRQGEQTVHALTRYAGVSQPAAPTEGGTHLRMEHGSFGPDQEAAYKGATYGWKRFLGQLEKVLDGGVL